MRPVRGSLVGPWALGGLSGGYAWSISFGLQSSGDAAIGVMLVVLTPIVASLFGWALTRHARARGRFSTPLTAAATVVAGQVNGVFVGAFAGAISEFPTGIVLGPMVGAIFGLLCAVPFIVPFVVVERLARARGLARPGTLVDGSDRRLPWMVVAPGSALGLLAGVLTARSPPFTAVVVACTCVVFALGLLLSDVCAFCRVRAQEKRAGGWVLDVGVGDETVTRIVPATSAYRDVDREVSILRGSTAAAKAVLARRIALGLVCVAVTAVPAYAVGETWVARLTLSP